MKRAASTIFTVAGAGCLVYGASLIVPWLAWVVAGVALLARGVALDLTEEPDGTHDDRPAS